MNPIFRDLPFVTTYVDDILIHSTDKSQHLLHLREVFSRLSKANLTLQGKKCQIAMSQVPYLGHVFSEQKLSAVEEWPTPQNAADVRKFLGLTSYYRRYILHFSDIDNHYINSHKKVPNLYGLMNTVMHSTPSKTSWYKP